ncbi:hypothetical protein TURU_037032 [Turdus rufiventris]|nr:hypothetical protein TURU_037032 [Turdus rufiventris]
MGPGGPAWRYRLAGLLRASHHCLQDKLEHMTLIESVRQCWFTKLICKQSLGRLDLATAVASESFLDLLASEVYLIIQCALNMDEIRKFANLEVRAASQAMS